ncbi:MAG: YqeG family HAD IIIA-type phosphatase [Clostridiaceae bacterium]|nr:YqeG family HAD IIIA-type phosphatase [Clostridiaceae bacterium]
MVEKFFPDEIVDKVQDIDLGKLWNKGIKGLLLDIDNTLVPSYMKEADNSAIKWIKEAKNRGFKLCIVSNAAKRRVEKFNERIKLNAIYRALKPMSGSFRRAVALMGLKPGETATIGDQVFTDIYGGKRLGIYTILVKPLHKKESLFVRLKRYPERYILKKYYEAIKKGKSNR